MATSTFVDHVQISIKAGNGGNGCVSFRREKYVPRGGPDGGDGGDGGNVIVMANPHMRTLLDFRYRQHFAAGRGGHGQGANKQGKKGEDRIIQLPVGTVIIDSVTKKAIADLTRPDQCVLVARGGKGGRGNARFVSPTNQVPQYSEPGEIGQELILILELKLLADVGLVGLPNAGKSTLLSRISAAKPKIADYPFTTLVPNLGIVKVSEDGSFVAADIPGLIEGAHIGKGLGIRFLRHIERTKIIALLLDITSPHLDQDYKVLLKEMESYGKGLSKKPKIIVLTKDDLQSQQVPEFRDKNKALEVCRISSITGKGLDHLKALLFQKFEDIGTIDNDCEFSG
jgi:GTP-binding protein